MTCAGAAVCSGMTSPVGTFPSRVLGWPGGAPRAASLSVPAVRTCWAGGLGATIGPVPSVVRSACIHSANLTPGARVGRSPVAPDQLLGGRVARASGIGALIAAVTQGLRGAIVQEGIEAGPRRRGASPEGHSGG